jgi:hypothetical protein
MASQSSLPAGAYIPFELGIYAVAIWVVISLARRGEHAKIPVMLAAMVFAGALEIYDIRSTHTYHYDRFLLMWGDWPNWFPVCIAVAWGLVLHSTMEAAEHLRVAPWGRPLVAALLAVSVDLLLDPVVASSRIVAEPAMACDATWIGPGEAIGLSFWVWCVPKAEHALLWGIPFGNFFAWGAVTAGYAAVASLLFARFGKGASLALQCALAAVSGFVAYHVVGQLLTGYGKIVGAGVPEWAMLVAAFGPGAVLIALAGGRRLERSVRATTWVFVASTLFFSYCAMVVQPIVREQLTASFIVYAVAVGVGCAALYYWVLVGRRPGAQRQSVPAVDASAG